ncbi:MAG: hypothetical protein CMO55_23175 [Verrucomicrobiales bacterium]|nr:hypothetical protein [Verrucomicrobiales bacterium]
MRETNQKMSEPSHQSPSVRPAIRALSVSTGALVALLAAGAFALSFEALRHLAAENGVASNLTWVWPLVLDGAIVAFSLSALRARLHCEPIRYPMTLVVIATLASVLFNVAHAPGGWLAHTMAAVPPVFLFLSFELLMRQLGTEVARGEELHSLDTLAEERRRLEASCSRLERQIEGLKENRDQLKLSAKSASMSELLEKANRSKQEKIEARRAKVAELNESALSVKEISELLAVSPKTIRRDLEALEVAA